jgi:ribosomal protein S12 methylthiotransferase accessory factor
MIGRPAIKASFHPEVVDGEGVFLLSERGYFLLRGALYCRLAPLLDGTLAVDEIVERLAGDAAAANVYFALATLEEKGYIAEAGGAPPEATAFWQSLGLDAQRALSLVRDATVAVERFGSIAADSADSFAEALGRMDVRVAPRGELAVALTDDYLAEGLSDFDAAALAARRPWMLVKPVGAVLWIGPVFRPGATGCWECLAHALRQNRRIETYVQQRTGRTQPFPVSRAALTSTIAAALHLAAVETVKALASDSPVEDARLVTIDLATLESQAHVLVRRPQCARCGAGPEPPGRPALPLRLESRPKRFTSDGGHRTRSPGETFAAYEGHVGPILGAVSSLRRYSRGDRHLMNVYVAGQGIGREPSDLNTLRQGLRTQSCGKGATESQAKASALCEALERYSGILQGDERKLRASLRSLGARAIDPNASMLFSETQYARRRDADPRTPRAQFVPAPFDADAEIDWTPVWSLTRDEARYLPTEYCFYGPVSEGATSPADSNGCAAGNTLEEAILQGFLELVERDGVALWWYSRAPRPAVDLESFDEPHVRELQRLYRELGRELWVLDVTSDLGIPTFAAVSHRYGEGPEELAFGYGAHLEARLALLRALSELNQMISTVREGAAEAERLAKHPYVAPSRERPRVKSDYARNWSEDLRDDVVFCRAAVEREGLEMLVLDQTRPEIGLPVVKVVVPGLRHFWPRFAPGRLYDVPVRLGWIPARLEEHELNPIPAF